MVNSPKLAPLNLPELDDGDLSQLSRRAVIEGVRFGNAQFDDLDLTDAVISESLLERVSVAESVLRGIRISESQITALNAPVLSAPLSQWRDVRITGSRIGSAELFESQWTGSHIGGCKLGYVNLRGATLANTELIDCTIDELDLGQATATRVALRDCRIGTLDLTRAKMKDIDLRGTSFEKIVGIEGMRGVTIDEVQLSILAPHLAGLVGILLE